MATMVLNKEFEQFWSTELMESLLRHNSTKTDVNADDISNQLDMIDFLQLKFSCCGVESYEDWRQNTQLASIESLPDTVSYTHLTLPTKA